MRSLYFLSIVLIFTGFSCKNHVKKNSSNTVTVTVLPQKFFVNQIAGSWLNVNVMIPDGSSHHTYEPTPQQMKELSNSDAYFSTGQMPFEHAWVDKFKSVNPGLKIFDVSNGISLIAESELCLHDNHNHNHGHNHLHSNNNSNDYYNPHIWLSPAEVKIQAQNIFNALKTVYPQHQGLMAKNLDNFLLKCDSVNIEIENRLKPFKGASFIVYHPAWTYLARNYGLNEIAIEHNGKEATITIIKDIVDFAKSNNIKLVFVQKEYSQMQAQTIASQINGNVVELNPLNYNWYTNVDDFLKAIELLNK